MKTENTPELITERLILRKFTEEDREALYEILKDEEVNKFLPWFPTASLKEAEIFLKERYLDSYKKERGYQYAICLRGENRPVGYIGASMEEHHDLGYGLRREYWNRGIVTEAGRAVRSTFCRRNRRRNEAVKKSSCHVRFCEKFSGYSQKILEKTWKPLGKYVIIFDAGQAENRY